MSLWFDLALFHPSTVTVRANVSCKGLWKGSQVRSHHWVTSSISAAKTAFRPEKRWQTYEYEIWSRSISYEDCFVIRSRFNCPCKSSPFQSTDSLNLGLLQLKFIWISFLFQLLAWGNTIAEVVKCLYLQGSRATARLFSRLKYQLCLFSGSQNMHF